MPSAAHQTLAYVLQETPGLLSETLSAWGRAVPAGALRVLDSTVRSQLPTELRPDLLFSSRSPRWCAVELQRQRDADKATMWPLLASTLHHRLGAPGDLLVVTHRRDVGRWARRVTDQRGPLGSWLRFKPSVLVLSGTRLQVLLDP